MQIWLDDYDSIKVIAATKDGEIVAKITSDGEVYIKGIIPQNPED